MERLKVLIKHAGSNPYKCCNTASFLSESQTNSPKHTENGNVHIYIYIYMIIIIIFLSLINNELNVRRVIHMLSIFGGCMFGGSAAQSV